MVSLGEVSQIFLILCHVSATAEIFGAVFNPKLNCANPGVCRLVPDAMYVGPMQEKVLRTEQAKHFGVTFLDGRPIMKHYMQQIIPFSKNSLLLSNLIQVILEQTIII